MSCTYDKAVRDLGFKTRPLSDMIEPTIRWLRDQHLLEEASDPVMRHARTDARLGVEYVDVEDEPNHVECLRNDYVRVYLATIAPGTSTLYHRHRENTLYIVMQGGLYRAEVPGKQKQPRIGLPRSLGLATKLTWAVRQLVLGTIPLPTSMLLVQHHRAYPLIHRVCSPASNTSPMKLLGIEVFPPANAHRSPAPAVSGFTPEYRDNELAVHRIQMAYGRSTGHRHLGVPSLLVSVAGKARLGPQTAAGSSTELAAGSVHWLGDAASLDLASEGDEALDTLLILLT